MTPSPALFASESWEVSDWYQSLAPLGLYYLPLTFLAKMRQVASRLAQISASALKAIE